VRGLKKLRQYFIVFLYNCDLINFVVKRIPNITTVVSVVLFGNISFFLSPEVHVVIELCHALL